MLLRTEKLPHMKGAKWHRVFVESDGTSHKLTKTTIPENMIEGNKLYFPHDLSILDVKFDCHNVEYSTSGNPSLCHDVTFTQSGATYISLPSAKGYDYMYIYVLAVKH